MMRLRLKDRPDTFWEFEDDTPTISIGRASSNDVSLLEETLSRNHAVVTFQNGRHVLRAKATSNATQVNGETVTSKQLEPGDEIRLGNVVFIFESGGRLTDAPEESRADALGPEAADIYEELLGIPKGQRPPNHYQLIGIDDFEPDVERIKKASLNRVAALRKHQLDPRFGDAVQDLLTDVARARVTLCNSRRKIKYDNELKRKAAIESGIAVAEDDETYQLIMPEIDTPMEERLDSLRRTVEFMILEAGIDPDERDKILREEAESFDVDFSEVEEMVRQAIAIRDSQPPMQEEAPERSTYDDLLSAAKAWTYDNILTEPPILLAVIAFLLFILLVDPPTFFRIVLVGIAGAAAALTVLWVLSNRS